MLIGQPVARSTEAPTIIARAYFPETSTRGSHCTVHTDSTVSESPSVSQKASKYVSIGHDLRAFNTTAHTASCCLRARHRWA